MSETKHPILNLNGHTLVDQEARDAAAQSAAAAAANAEEIGKLSKEIVEKDIPKIFYDGALPQTKNDAVMKFRLISGNMDVDCYCETKAQGTSSMNWPKKNQTTKLYVDDACTKKLKVGFRNWGAQSKYCLKANWIDLTHARNIVSARLWGDVVRSRANFAELPELLRTSPNMGAIDGFPVKVYAGGVYQGRYTLNIPKDAWMANMDKDNQNHCILCGENYGSGCFRAAAKIDGSDWSDELHDTVPDNIKTRWNEVISFVMNSTDDEFKSKLGSYFDVDSLLDYHLFGLASCGLDGYGKNQLYMTYDGKKWIATMYDMDSTWGLWWTGAEFKPTNYGRDEFQDFKDGEGNLLYIRLEQCFHEELKARWAELRVGALSVANIINRFERFTDIASADLVNEDYASTTGNGKFTGIPSKTTNNIQQIRAFAVARHAWADDYVAMIPLIACKGIALDKTELVFTEQGTQSLVATLTPPDCNEPVVWESDNIGVARVVDGAVISANNGTATITARCGKYSATCSVSVTGITEHTLYSLPETTTFDGTNYIDTGVQLAKEDTAFTIILHAKGDSANARTATLFHCIDEADDTYPGYSCGSEDTYRVYPNIYGKLTGGCDTYIPVAYDREFKLVITRAAGSGTVNVMSLREGNFKENSYTITDMSTWHEVDNSLLIGCYQMPDGAKGRFWKGTLYDFSIYNEVWSDDRIEAYLGVSKDNALYPLKNGTYNVEGTPISMTISNGSHVAIACSTSQFYANFTRGEIDDGDSTYTYTDKLFTLKAGDVVRMKLKNIIMNDLAATCNLSPCLLSASGEIKPFGTDIVLSAIGSERNGEITISEDVDIGSVNAWMGMTAGGSEATIAFDLILYVNGERYI